MSDLGQTFEEIIRRTVQNTLSERDLPDSEFVATDNLGEIVEKLAIIHIRMWMLEDAIQAATTDKEIAELKRKCTKKKNLKKK